MLHVFLKNKLISSDAIIPVLLQARREGMTRKIRFYLQSPKTLEALQENSILWAGLNELGDVFLAVPKNRKLSEIIAHRLATLIWLPSLAASIIFGKSKILHFGQLYNSTLYRLLIGLRKESVMVVEGAFEGFSKGESDFALLQPDRKETYDLSLVSNIAVFNGSSELAKKIISRGREPIVIGKPHVLFGWNEFLEKQSISVFPEEHDEIYTVILGTFEHLDFFPSPDTAEELLKETIEIILSEDKNRPIYLKPHAITNKSKLENIISIYENRPVYVSNLHPLILAKRSVLTIANYYSTVLATVHSMNGITVEYTRYSDKAMQLSGGESMRPESVTHFIDNDPDALSQLISSVKSIPARGIFTGKNTSLDKRMLDWLH